MSGIECHYDNYGGIKPCILVITAGITIGLLWEDNNKPFKVYL